MTVKLALSTPPRASPRWRPRLGWPDAGALFGLFLAAAALRLPHLLTVPRFTDEQIEVLYALPLYRLQGQPLIGPDPYNGPLHSYLLAAALWLFGPHPYTPRLLSLLLGSAAVAVTYLLGHRLGGRIGGLVGAGLLMTSAPHILVNSHVAWSNSVTPLLTTIGFCALLPAVVRGSGRHLVAGGLAFGLALQTHPSVAAFFPGAGLAVALRWPILIRGPWLPVSVAIFILAYSNVLLYNLRLAGEDPYRQTASGLIPDWLRTREDTLSGLVHQQRTYAGGQGGAQFYLANLGSLGLNLPRVAGSLLEPRPAWWDHLLQPGFWIYGTLLATGLIWPLRRANPLPFLSGLSYLLLLPLFHGKYEPIFDGRYLMPLLPLGFAGFGSLVEELWRTISRSWLRLSLLLAMLALAVLPLNALFRYEQRASPEGQINLDLIESATALATARLPSEPIILDEVLGRRGMPADGDLLQSLRLFLELKEVSYQVAPVSATRLEAELGTRPSALVVFAQPYERTLEDRFVFSRLEERPSGRYGVYRLQRRG